MKLKPKISSTSLPGIAYGDGLSGYRRHNLDPGSRMAHPRHGPGFLRITWFGQNKAMWFKPDSNKKQIRITTATYELLTPLDS